MARLLSDREYTGPHGGQIAQPFSDELTGTSMGEARRPQAHEASV